ncbi:MAG: hypothetical protein AAF960_25645 [Bacteroidota bacterium]
MRKFLSFVLFFGLLVLFSCNKENRDIIEVLVLEDGVPVPNYGVALASGDNTFGWAETNQEGIANIDLQGAVLGEPENYVLVTTSSRSKWGYTVYKGAQQLHTINVHKDEILEVKVLSPSNLETTVYNFGDVIDIKLQMTSNQTLLNFRQQAITHLSGNNSGIDFPKNINNVPLTLTDSYGILNFKYTVKEVHYEKEGQAGFVVSFENADGQWAYYVFRIEAR